MAEIDDVFDDANAAPGVTDEGLKSVSRLVRRDGELKEEISSLEDVLRERKDELRKLREDQLPAAMDEVGLTEFKADDGTTVKVKQKVYASIPKALEDEAFEWLRQNNHEDLIKNEVKVAVPKGKGNLAGDLTAYAEKLGLSVERKRAVHPQTLAAFCREQLEAGAELPEKLLGVHAPRVAEVQRKSK